MHALCRIRILVLMLTLVSLVSCAKKAKVDVAVEPSEPRTFQALEPTVGVEVEAPEVVLRRAARSGSRSRSSGARTRGPSPWNCRTCPPT